LRRLLGDKERKESVGIEALLKKAFIELSDALKKDLTYLENL
jgi:hypothetical protein